jgi:hypothetical protein
MDYESLKTPADDVVRDDASFEAYRLPGDLIDSQHPDNRGLCKARGRRGQ